MSKRRDAVGCPLQGGYSVFGWNAGLLALGTTCAGNKRAGVVLVKVRHMLRSPAACGAEALALFSPHAGIMTDRCCLQQAKRGSMRMPAGDMCQYPPERLWLPHRLRLRQRLRIEPGRGSAARHCLDDVFRNTADLQVPLAGRAGQLAERFCIGAAVLRHEHPAGHVN
jgi:hypothetical protein